MSAHIVVKPYRSSTHPKSRPIKAREEKARQEKSRPIKAREEKARQEKAREREGKTREELTREELDFRIARILEAGGVWGGAQGPSRLLKAPQGPSRPLGRAPHGATDASPMVALSDCTDRDRAIVMPLARFDECFELLACGITIARSLLVNRSAPQSVKV